MVNTKKQLEDFQEQIQKMHMDMEADARKNIHTELLRVQNDDIIIDATGIKNRFSAK